MNQILHIFDIHAPAREIFFALTLKNGVAGWWNKEVDFDDTRALFKFQFRDEFNPVMKIVRQHEDQEVRWQCIDGYALWNQSTLTFSMQEKRDVVQLTFTHTFAEEISGEDYGRFNFNWGFYLDSLRLYCETGTGKPFRS